MMRLIYSILFPLEEKTFHLFIRFVVHKEDVEYGQPYPVNMNFCLYVVHSKNYFSIHIL